MLWSAVGIAGAAESGNFKYTSTGPTTVSFDGCVVQPSGEFAIPATILVPGTPDVLKNVTTIKTGAFFNYQNVTGITIPDGVVTIGNNAFYGCIALQHINIPTSVISIGNNVFNGCYALSSVDIPSSVATPSSLQSIGSSAFSNCQTLKSVSLPASVSSVGPAAFSICGKLTSISVDGLNPTFASENGVMFNKTKTSLVAFPSGTSGGYEIPSTVTTILDQAFYYSVNLTGITMPASLSAIGTAAFYGCSKLVHVSFRGDAPTLGGSAFVLVGPGFTLHHFAGAVGFDVAPWDIYNKVVMAPTTPLTEWLLTKGLPTDTNINSDVNGDGVSPLLAYALGLNPNLNLSGKLPQAVLSTNQMSMTFYGGAAGVTYAVEQCTNFSDWTTTGVVLSAPDVDQMVTATVDMAGTGKFLRLVATH